MCLQFEIVELIDELVGRKLRNGDVLVISSKFIAISEGRILSLEKVRSGGQARRLSKQYNISPELCELVIRESDGILGGVVGFILTIKDGLITPNAGIDRSNIEHGKVVLYPRRPIDTALLVMNTMKFRYGVDIGVVISDSRLMPTRKGTTGVALVAVGLESILDLRGKYDLFGNVLRVTSQAIADDLCSGAQLLMGESSESIPLVLVRGLDRGLLKKTKYMSESFSIPIDQCVYMRSLGFKRKVLRVS
jgi:coenzyme F420-0:L-glutamate ligase